MVPLTLGAAFHYSIFHEIIIYLLSHLLLYFFRMYALGSSVWQFQSAVLICRQNVFILLWVTGGSSREFVKRSAFEPKFNTACLNSVTFCAFCSKLVSKYNTNLYCCLTCFPLDLSDEVTVRYRITSQKDYIEALRYFYYSGNYT